MPVSGIFPFSPQETAQADHILSMPNSTMTCVIDSTLAGSHRSPGPVDYHGHGIWYGMQVEPEPAHPPEAGTICGHFSQTVACCSRIAQADSTIVASFLGVLFER